jgi:hypothetical protein
MQCFIKSSSLEQSLASKYYQHYLQINNDEIGVCVARMGKMRTANEIPVGKPSGLLGRLGVDGRII